MVLGRYCKQRLGGQHVFHFAGADAEGQGPDRAVGGRVAVAADDGHARLRIAQFGPDHVHDSLVGVADIVQADAELLAIVPQRLDLLL